MSSFSYDNLRKLMFLDSRMVISSSNALTLLPDTVALPTGGSIEGIHKPQFAQLADLSATKPTVESRLCALEESPPPSAQHETSASLPLQFVMETSAGLRNVPVTVTMVYNSHSRRVTLLFPTISFLTGDIATPFFVPDVSVYGIPAPTHTMYGITRVRAGMGLVELGVDKKLQIYNTLTQASFTALYTNTSVFAFSLTYQAAA